jgi:hypothetical protein
MDGTGFFFSKKRDRLHTCSLLCHALSVLHGRLQGQLYCSDKLTLSLDVFCREKPKSECFVPSQQPDFAGMMRPGHDQSTPFGLSATSTFQLSLVPVGQSCRFALVEVPAIGQIQNIALLVLWKSLGVAAATPNRGKGAPVSDPVCFQEN